ncbi:hypothetical protein [Streptomyces collinus]|uniref:hypothetical protein n=1 Tax=Streptomyces collinus TaxID=42684 RepID=UPI00294288F4|nr:hypothetical protein [Streptomyces collinus]
MTGVGHGTHLSPLASVVTMAWSGLLVTAVVPGAARLLARSPLWERLSVPAPVALPLLVLTHAWPVLGEHVGLRPPGGALVTRPALLTAAVLFRLPVTAHTRHRPSDPGRCPHPFLAAPRGDALAR